MSETLAEGICRTIARDGGQTLVEGWLEMAVKWWLERVVGSGSCITGPKIGQIGASWLETLGQLWADNGLNWANYVPWTWSIIGQL